MAATDELIDVGVGHFPDARADRLDPDQFDLGRGKRQIAKGGRLHRRYEITVPADLMPGGEEQDGG